MLHFTLEPKVFSPSAAAPTGERPAETSTDGNSCYTAPPEHGVSGLGTAVEVRFHRMLPVSTSVGVDLCREPPQAGNQKIGADALFFLRNS